MNEDFLDILLALTEAEVEFMVVGAHALAVHGVPRATGDLDIWVRPTAENAPRVIAALKAFGAPLANLAIETDDFLRIGSVVQIGIPPRRIDVLTSITAVAFDEAWPDRVTRPVKLGETERDVSFLGRAALMTNKRSTGRTKDLADVERLETPREDS